MTELEKLQALLAEARHEIATWHLGPRDPLVRRIDAALAEPVVRCGECNGELTESRPGRHQCVTCETSRVVGDLIRERDEARAEADKLREVLLSKHGGEPLALLRELDKARAEAVAAYQRGAKAMRKTAARLVDDMLSHTLTDAADRIRALPICENDS